MKNSADQGGSYPQRPKAAVDNTLLALQILYMYTMLYKYCERALVFGVILFLF